jgi:hypothetical protein
MCHDLLCRVYTHRCQHVVYRVPETTYANPQRHCHRSLDHSVYVQVFIMISILRRWWTSLCERDQYATDGFN